MSSDTDIVRDITELEALYGKPVERSLTKVTPVITPLYKRWIEASRFLVISSVGEGGCDCSPRGDINNLVKVVDDTTLWLPDWSGNNRLDNLHNIITDGRVSLMFMVNGCNNVIRINGHAVLSTNQTIREEFTRKDKTPKTVVVVSIGELYFQCAKALMRSELWNSDTARDDLPTAGQFSKEQDESFDSVTYDEGYYEYAQLKFW